MSSLIHNPKPVPLSPLVVKNGSKIRETVAGDIPGPVSAIVKISPFSPVFQFVPSRLRTRSRPPEALIASIAFPTRLLKTWRTSPSKQRTECEARSRRGTLILELERRP